MRATTQTLEELSRLLSSASQALPGDAQNVDVERFAPMRGRAASAIAKAAWPTGKEETWRYTQAAPLALTDLGLAPQATCSWEALEKAFPQDALSASRLVFVNGHFASEHSKLPSAAKLSVTTLAEASAEQLRAWAPYLGTLGATDEPNFAALNASFLRDGVVIHIPRGERLDEALQTVFFSTEEAAQNMVSPRILVILEERAEATVVELHACASDAVMWSNGVTECHVGANAHLRHAVLQKIGQGSLWMNHTSAKVGANASFSSDFLSMGAAWSRRELTVRLTGDAAHTRLTGLTLGAHAEHADQQVRVEHVAEHTTSHQHFRSLLDGQSVGVFGGMVYVAPGAQKTDAKQMSRNLILSSQARAHAKPGLEILADDVKCAHGATVSQLDEEGLFYLRSRGISDSVARSLLVMAFARALLGEVDPCARALFEKVGAARMGGEHFMEDVTE